MQTTRAAVPLLALVLALLIPLSGCTGVSQRAGASVAAARASPSVTSSVTAAPLDSFRSTRTLEAVAPPVRIRIPAAHVNSRLQRLGRAADGTIQVPSDPDIAGWYARGPRPGQPGPAVILGHVDSTTGPAVFFDLVQVRRGDAIHVDRSDGTTVDFRITRLLHVAKNRFPTELVYAPTLEVSLRLVTCGGSLDPKTGHYRDNVIVFATAL